MELQSVSVDVEKAYLAHKADVMRFLVSFGLNTVDAEDITQDAFLRVMDPSPGARPPENFFRWLVTCTRNLAINRFRRRRREVPITTEMQQRWECTLRGREEPIDAQMQRKQLLLSMQRALNECLGPMERSCLILRSRGATYRTMAAELDITMDRAIYLTGRAIEKVHQHLRASV